MNLPRETTDFLVWLGRVIRQFLRIRPGATLVAIGASALGRVTRVLVFFLPLKVILLVASDGVPRYFPVQDPEAKMLWVTGLSIGAFVAYGFTLALDALSRRLGDAASVEVLQGANEMTVLSQQDRVVKQAYTGICQFIAAVLFVSVVGLVLLVVNQLLLAFLVVMVSAQYVVTAYLMRGGEMEAGATKSWITENKGYYLRILASVNFLGAFLVVLSPFLAAGHGNIIVAVLSIILARQGTNTLVPAVMNAMELYSGRHRISALVFRKTHLKQEPGDRSLWTLFNKSRRQQRTMEVLGESVNLQGEPDVRWMDSPVRHIVTLLITEPAPGGRHFQQQVFPARQAYRLSNEEFLFRYIPRDKLGAPEVVSRFRQGSFECQICEYGLGQRPSTTEWEEAERDLLIALWACRPPKGLVMAYRASHPLLYQRLNGTLVEHLRVAVDTARERRTLDQLLAALPAIRERLRMIPLAVHNPDLDRLNTVRTGEGNRIMTWIRWSLEPLGGGGETPSRRKMLIEALPLLREKRKDIPADLDAEDIDLAAQCHRLEVQINRNRYKAGLRSGSNILRNTRLVEATKVA